MRVLKIEDIDSIDIRNKVYISIAETDNAISLYKAIAFKHPQQAKYKMAFMPLTGTVVNDNITTVQYYDKIELIQYFKAVVSTLLKSIGVENSMVKYVVEFENNDEFFRWLSTIHVETSTNE